MLLLEVGTWASAEQPDLPDIAGFVVPYADGGTRSRLAAWLGRGELITPGLAPEWCRFRCPVRYLSSNLRSDGVYVWPEALLHYVTVHDVWLPQEVVAHALTGRPRPLLTTQTVDSSWWRAQPPLEKAGRAAFHTPGLGGSVWFERLDSVLGVQALRWLQRHFPRAGRMDLPTLRRRVESGAPFQLAEDVDWVDMAPLLEEATLNGMVLAFREGGSAPVTGATPVT